MKSLKLVLVLSIMAMTVSAQQQGVGISFLGNDYYSLQTNKATLFLNDSSWFRTFDKGIRLSYIKNISKWFDVSTHLNYSWVDVPNSDSDGNFIQRRWDNYVGHNPRKNYIQSFAEADVRMNLNILDRTKYIAAPYIFGGVSGSINPGNFGLNAPLGLGLNVKFAKNWSLNAEAARRLALSKAPEFDRNQYALGLIYWGGASAKVKKVVEVSKPLDTDGDGLADTEDACPELAGITAFSGCPDTDGDGIKDSEDACPLVIGVASYRGCPIPDTDGDGFNDDQDKCPKVAGMSKYGGCPIPDTDGDGFNDEVDKCITLPSATNNGCPEIKKDVIDKVNKAAGAVFFDTGKSTIKPASLKQLDVIVNVLKEDATLFCDIAGHTDNAGDYTKNVTLSKSRAKACLDYIVSKGIDVSRLTSEGYGPDQPKADNKTAAGRAQNRRTEFKLRNF